MHLMIPCASAVGEAAGPALQTLALPRLAALLGLLNHVEAEHGDDELSPDTPFERALAAARGWPEAAPGCLPLAAEAARADGVEVGTACWALVTPLHLSVGSDQILALDPAQLHLKAADSRALLADLAAELCPAAEGWQHAFGDATRWYLAHPSLEGLASSSLERVINRPVDAWMPRVRALRTLQNEMQMLLHRHPLNAAREAAGELPVNSVWIHGCGRALAGALPADLRIDTRLREPLLAGDWAAWCEAWQALDAGPIAELLARARAGEPGLALTLCGDRLARRWVSGPRSGWARLWQRLSPPQADPQRLLEAL